MRLRRIEPIVRRALEGPCALEPGSTVLVAVSGGADSTALLIAMHALAPAFDFQVRAAHLNHRLRGADADADQAFVESLAEELGVPIDSARWNTRLRMKRRGWSGQAGLRRLRQTYLTDLARRHGAAAIATAHTAQDQLETLLLRLGRGTGLRGLGGIAPRRGSWIRPLLEAGRDAIEADLRAQGVEWRVDASNADPAYARNRMRHRVIPELARVFDNSVAQLAAKAVEVAEEARRSDEALRWVARRVLSRIGRIEGSAMELRTPELLKYPKALQQKVLSELWAARKGGLEGLTQRHLRDLSGLVRSDRGGASLSLPEGWQVTRDREMLQFRQPTAGGSGARLPRTRWASAGVRSRWVSGPEARESIPAKSQREEYFAAEGISGKLELRVARADERFTPFGRQRAVRLGTFLRKQRISRELKSHPIVLSDAGGILWVVGVRRSARARVTPDTRKVLRVHTERHD